PLASFTWTCTPSGAGAACGTASSTGSIDALVTLPAGAGATFLVRGAVAAGAAGPPVHNATGPPPTGVTALVPGNNSATPTNPSGGAQADLSITKASTPTPYVPGAPLTYTIVVSNAGPSNVVGARVQDALPAPLASFTWTCTPSGSGAACATPAGTRTTHAPG